jgi:hypothetical protein
MGMSGDKRDEESRGDVTGDAGKRSETRVGEDGGEMSEVPAHEEKIPSAASPEHTGADSNPSAGIGGNAPHPLDIVLRKEPKRPQREKTHVGRGIGLGFLLHLILLIYPAAFIAIGIVQLVYILPAIMIFRKHPGMVQGLLIAAGITFLLNAACYGYMTFSFRL